ncbi:MAG: hypothetical protein FJ104_02440, partial [Deltaproteobacteria bacterium]|nr:hypothetical protein [Deltaproteobacteria bacterium]
ANHHVYSFSECHQHYHFDHFATFTYGDDPDLGSKRAFCLESVARYANHEKSPLWSPYNVCSYQGISAGWGDQYNAGIECQWIDVTSVDTTTAPVTRALGLRSNPEGILCEGEPVRGADGEPVWEPTELRTPLGEVVDRPACTEAPRWEENNYGEHPVTLPLQGEGMLTSPCERGQIGPRRNCGFKAETDLRSCTPGATVTLSCTIGALGAPAVVRVCEASVQLGSGLACMDADALGAATVGGGETVEVSFPCPSRRDAMEPGGSYSLYTAAAWPGDDLPAVDCVAR